MFKVGLEFSTAHAIFRLATEGHDAREDNLQTPKKRPAPSAATSLPADLIGSGYALPGTLASRYMRCGKPNCRCKAEPSVPHGPYRH